MRASVAFVVLAALGVGEAIYHAWQEKAFTTAWSSVSFGPYASLYGVPYWAFGLVWFPLVLIFGIWASRSGRSALPPALLVLLSVGNLFTVYLWNLDLNIVGSMSASYLGLYVTNYALTGLVIVQNWKDKAMQEFTAGTGIGLVAGVFFGAFGIVLFGVFGGLFGAIGGYTASRS